jgi:hypothetical protein
MLSPRIHRAWRNPLTAESAVPQHDDPDSRPTPEKRGHWLSHAFAIDPEGASEPTEEQARVVDRVCQEIVRRRLTAPALLYLEISRPLNYIGSQFLHFVRPILAVMLDTHGLEQFASFLEKRGSVDTLVARLEDAESSHENRKTERGC